MILKMAISGVHPPTKNASILLFNTVSIYTRIDTKDCIERLIEYLLNPVMLQKFKH